MSQATPAVVYRVRPYPIWLCFGMGGFLLLIAGLASLSVVLTSTPEPSGPPSPGLVALIVVVLGAPALFIMKMGADLARAKVAIGPDGVDLVVHRFRIWGLRHVASASLKWPDVLGVQTYEIPNFAAPNGTQVDYVLHTTQGLFVVPAIQFKDADEIARSIAARIGRAVGDLPPTVTPVTAATPGGRRGVRLMRGLGWFSSALGLGLPLLLLVAWWSGERLEVNAIGGITAASITLLLAGRSLRRFALK